MVDLLSQAARLLADFGFHPVTSAELEFYLHGAKSCPDMDQFWREVTSRVALSKHEEERGHEQFEIALPIEADPQKTISALIEVKTALRDAAAARGRCADFSAKPFPDQPGSGLHIHIHLADKDGKNVFYKDDHTISDALKWSIGGLLAWLPDTMPVFAPHPESYARFSETTHAPSTVSWGANNRTVAVRLPDAPHDGKHIEHRVAGADADPERVMAVILAAMHDGLTRRLDPGAQIYGDASLAIYNLPPLPKTLEEGIARMEKSETVLRYFSPTGLAPASGRNSPQP